MARRILALDVGTHSLKAAVIESTLRQCRVVGLYRHPRESTRPLADQLKEFRIAHALHADTMVSCAPGDAVALRFLELPFTRLRQLEQITPFELDGEIPFDLDAVLVDFHIVRRLEERTTVLAVAVPTSTLTAHLETLATAGFDPTSIDVAALAPLALLSLAGADLSGPTALLDIGENRTALVSLQDGTVRGVRTLSLGLSRAGGFPTLIQELRWTLLAWGDGVAALPERLFLCGGGSRVARLRDELAQALAVDVIPFQDLVLPPVSESQQQEQGAFAVCLGLGLREALKLPAPTVNLRKGMFAHQGRREALRREFLRLGWAAAGVAAAAGLTFTLEMSRLNTRYNALRQEIRRVFSSTLPEVQTIVSEKAQLRDAIDALRGQQQVFQGSATVSPLELLRQLSAALPDQISLDLDEWTFDVDSIRLRGSTTSFDAAETIKTTASGLGVFHDVQLKDVKTATGGKKVSFGLQLLLKKEGRLAAGDQ